MPKAACSGLPRSTLWLVQNDEHPRHAEAIQSDLAAAGIPVDLKPMLFSEYLSGYRTQADCWYGGWYPDWQVRLYDRRRARFEGDFVHESVRVPSPATLDGDLLHYTVESLSDHHRRLDRYTSLAAEALAARGRSFSAARAVLEPPVTFLQTYLLKQGFRDGAAGLAIAGFAAYYVFLRQVKLWERTR